MVNTNLDTTPLPPNDLVAQDPQSAELAGYVRTKTFGRDVREAIARSIELNSTRSKSAEILARETLAVTNRIEEDTATATSNMANQVELIRAEKDVVIANATQDSEVILARGVDVTLAKRLDNFESSIRAAANATDKINLKNYLGNFENIHPKVLYFEKKFAGHYYWMAYTPYPIGKVEHENPCIAYSDDKINWYTPNGLTNPLDSQPVGGYNSDTHLVFREDTNTLEIWWRPFISDTGEGMMYRRTSTDGVNWSSKERLYSSKEHPSGIDILSPAVYFEDGKYKLYGVNINPNDRRVVYLESTDARNWGSISYVNIDWESQNLVPWHLDVIQTDLGLEFLVQAYNKGTNSNTTSDLYHVIKSPSGSISKPKLCIRRSMHPLAFDNQGIYRSSFIKENGTYYVFYSAIKSDNTRHMAMSYGNNMGGLIGYSSKNEAIQNNDVRFGDETIDEFRVEDIDTIYITGNATLNSLRGGYRNKVIKLVLFSGTSSLLIKNNARMTVPGNKDYKMINSDRYVVDLICTSDNGNYWRVASGVGYTPNSGTWTPRIDGATYARREGSYIRQSGVVHAWFEVELSSKTDVTSLLIRDLPFGAKNQGTVLIGTLKGVTSGSVVHGVVDKGTGVIRLLLVNNATSTTLTPGAVSDTFTISGCAIYESV